MKTSCPHCEGKTMCERGEPWQDTFDIIKKRPRSCPTCLKKEGYHPLDELVVICSICGGTGVIEVE